MPLSIAEATTTLVAPGQIFEISEQVVDGITTRVWKNCPVSLATILESSRGFGPAIYLVYEDERVSFEEHFATATKLAAAMSEHYGIQKGDRVAIAARNCPEWVVSFWAAASLGAVVVPLNAWWTGPELAYGLSDSESALAILDGERLERLSQHLGELRHSGLRHTLVVRSDEALGDAGPCPGTDRYEDVMGDTALATAGELASVAIGPDDDATIFYTSGTTGRPKGALGTQRNICTNLMSLGFITARNQLTATDDQREQMGTGGAQNCHLLSVPLFHATGCHSILVANTSAGGKLVMMRRFDPKRALELIERERVTIFGGVPAMAWQVLSSPELDRYDTSSVRSIAYGGAPAPPELVRRIKARFPTGNPSNGYGLTETSSVTSINSGEDYVRRPESVGLAVPVCEVRVVDADAKDVPLGEPGELWIKGPNVVRGYWKNPVATKESFTEGWLHTGDVARLDEDGFIYIVDRAKDVVIRGGENVYSVEVEAAIFEHPSIADAAVIGIPHEVLGEEVGAVVLLRQGAELSAAELQNHLGERIAAFKVPSHIYFRSDPLPRNPAGKVLKRQLTREVAK
ncbi:MAG: class I adenylate-forming enzyme family protein [Acidimicrobiales bacterium]